jgi:peroxiredoxin Q/BCP
MSRLRSALKKAVKEAAYPPMLPEGTQVPEWALQSWDDKWFRHNKGGWSVMVFYPGDDTPGCTRQLQDLQSHYAQFQELGAEVFGVNPAEAPSHEAFAKKFGFDFPILTDRGGSVARQFRAAVQLPMKTLILRSVYLVNPDGKIRLANRGAPPATALVRSIQALQQTIGQ